MSEPCAKEAVIAGMQSDIKTIFKRMDEQLAITKAVYEMSANMKVMATELKQMREAQGGMKSDIDELKEKPAKRYDAVVGAVLGALVTGVVTFLLFRLGLK